tara:strand:+ start:3627 stop:5906 length:2280 start_codon:yes stop_codon:yes gene_type:complete
MAETLISPGVLARENDSSQITQGPVEVGAAIIGPSIKGPVEVPTIVTSYSEYLAIFGGSVTSGSQQYSYLNQVAANNYFRQGGSTLLVTRVASGSFTSANSINLYNEVEVGGLESGFNLFTLINSNPTTGTVGNFVGAATVGGGNGNLTVNYTVATLDTFLPTATLTLPGGLVTADSPGNTAALATTGAGTGATVVVTGDGTNITGAVISNVGSSGYVAGATITVSQADMTNDGGIGTVGGDLVITIQQVDLKSTITAVTVNNPGTGYKLNDVVTIAAAQLGGASDATFLPLTAAAVENGMPFVLSTISQGAIMNSSGSLLTGGALANGSQNNLRWEITGRNTGSGVFSLAVRRGNDTTAQKSILETFNNVSLDPLATNYIETVIGNSYYSDVQQDGSDYYIQQNGSYVNRSKYIYVSAVNYPTPNYFDNAGNAKSQFTASIPLVSSGSFTNATGSLFPGGAAKFNESIDASNIQGIGPLDYTASINLLTNKDDYQFNVLSAPGLISEFHPLQVNLLVTTAEARQDCLSIIDLRGYGSTVGNVVGGASSFDTSYAATYWPWLQLVDPDSGRTIWSPASTLIPGVFAFTDASSDPWFAPAGLTRGGLGQVIRAERKLTSGNRDTLYEANINPIATFPQSGVVVFGQKTLQRKASALDRVNVRRLLIALKSYIVQVSDNLVFEQNTMGTRNNFLSQVNPYLESVQQRQGLYAFRVVMDETNNTPDVIDRNEMVGQIYLQPTKTAEFIILDFNVLPTGATFA